MDQNKLPPFPCQDELGNLPISTDASRMGVKVFTDTQTQQDLEQLRKVYESADAQAIKEARNAGINHGVCLALQLMHGHGDAGSTQWDELVDLVGRAEITHYAKHVEPDEWELCGFGQVERNNAEIDALSQ